MPLPPVYSLIRRQRGYKYDDLPEYVLQLFESAFRDTSTDPYGFLPVEERCTHVRRQIEDIRNCVSLAIVQSIKILNHSLRRDERSPSARVADELRPLSEQRYFSQAKKRQAGYFS